MTVVGSTRAARQTGTAPAATPITASTMAAPATAMPSAISTVTRPSTSRITPPDDAPSAIRRLGNQTRTLTVTAGTAALLSSVASRCPASRSEADSPSGVLDRHLFNSEQTGGRRLVRMTRATRERFVEPKAVPGGHAADPTLNDVTRGRTPSPAR